MNLVIDASVALRALLAPESEPEAQLVLEHMVRYPVAYAVPELFAFECYSVLVRHHPQPERAWSQGVEPLLTAGIQRYPFTPELLSASLPFVALGLTGYDAAYAGLAKLTSGLWLTYDKAAHKRLSGQGVSHLLTDGLPEGL